MRNQSILFGLALILAGCSSPGQFILQTQTSLSNITDAITNYNTFKAQIATNASYARLAYADTMKSTSLTNRRLPIQIMGDVCLSYAISKNVQDADIQARLKTLNAFLTTATDLLCSGTTSPPKDWEAPSTGAKSTDQVSAAACPITKQQASRTNFLALLTLFTDMASFTPAAGSATAVDAIAQALSNGVDLAEKNAYYNLTIAFLQKPSTQTGFEYAVERIESDLKDANDDLESNMHTWRKCETARLAIAQSKLAWNDGSSVLVFSREAVESKKTFDGVRKQYLAYKKTFVSNETSSLKLLETAFATLPTAQPDSASIDTIVKALGGVQKNLQTLEAASTSTTSTKSKTATAESRTLVALFSRPAPVPQTTDQVGIFSEKPHADSNTEESRSKRLGAAPATNAPISPHAEIVATPPVRVD